MDLPQIFIALFGCTAVFLLSRRSPWDRWAWLIGLAGQPFWIWAAYKAEQWGMLIVSLVYTYCWGLGVWKEFDVKRKWRRR